MCSLFRVCICSATYRSSRGTLCGEIFNSFTVDCTVCLVNTSVLTPGCEGDHMCNNIAKPQIVCLLGQEGNNGNSSVDTCKALAEGYKLCLLTGIRCCFQRPTFHP
jgi:hypothetical protein